MQVKRVVYCESVIHFFQSEILKYPDVETGGVMVGEIRKETIYVLKASDAGPNAIREAIYFKADPEYIQMFLDTEFGNSNGKLSYVGEWHTHPQKIPRPSEQDLNSLYEIAESYYNWCLMLIIGALGFSASKFNNQSYNLLKNKRYLNYYEVPTIISS